MHGLGGQGTPELQHLLESYGGMGRHFVSAGSAKIRRFTDEQGSHVLAA